MRKVLIGVLVLVVIVLGVSFYMNWLNISWAHRQDEKTGVTVGVDKEKFKHDMEELKNKTGDLAAGVKEGLTGHQTVRGVVQTFNAGEHQITVAFDALRGVTAEVNEQTKVFFGDKAGALPEVKEGDTVTMDTTVQSGKLLATTIRVETAS
jgi:hypothetical protein